MVRHRELRCAFWCVCFAKSGNPGRLAAIMDIIATAGESIPELRGANPLSDATS